MFLVLPWLLRLGFGFVGGFLAGGLFAKLSLGSAGNALAGTAAALAATSALASLGVLPPVASSPTLAEGLLTAGCSGLAGTFGAALVGLARRLISPPQAISIL